MPIFELGYRHWEGRRVSPLWRWLAIARAEVGIALRGSKLLRRAIFFAWMPLLYFGPLFLAVGFVADPSNDVAANRFLATLLRGFFPPAIVDQLRVHPEIFLPAIWAAAFHFFFVLVQFWLVLFIAAIVGPGLISRDVRTKAFLLYFSKPIGALEYFLGKLGALLFFLFAITLFPALVLYAISVLFSPGIGTSLETAFIVVRIFFASLAISLPVSTVVLLISSLTRDRRVATFGWVALWTVGELAYLLITTGARARPGIDATDWAPFLSLRELTAMATAAIFNVGGHFTDLAVRLESQGVDLTSLARSISSEGLLGRKIHDAIAAASGGAQTGAAPEHLAMIFLGALTVVCAFLILRRITKPVRI